MFQKCQALFRFYVIVIISLKITQGDIVHRWVDDQIIDPVVFVEYFPLFLEF